MVSTNFLGMRISLSIFLSSVYIHINQSTDPNSAVNIDINLANRLNNANLPTPSWKIKFTQLECPLKRHKFDLAKFGETENVNNDFNVLG